MPPPTTTTSTASSRSSLAKPRQRCRFDPVGTVSCASFMLRLTRSNRAANDRATVCRGFASPFRSGWRASATSFVNASLRSLAIFSVDVAVIGGGITGAAVAWRFAEAGVHVALVEGRAYRPRQHGGEHRAADAGTGRRLRGAGAALRRARARRIWAAQPRSDARLRRARSTAWTSPATCSRATRCITRTTARHARQLRSEHRMRVRAGLRADVARRRGARAARSASTRPRQSGRAATRRSIRTARASA